MTVKVGNIIQTDWDWDGCANYIGVVVAVEEEREVFYTFDSITDANQGFFTWWETGIYYRVLSTEENKEVFK